jgi:uncharacterized damage-inducible protein DinB
MDHTHVSELLDYHYWAQERVFDACEPLTPEQFTQDLGNSFKSVRDTLVHIHFAECIWYARWAHEPFTAPTPDMFPDLDSVRQVSRSHEATMRASLERLGQHGINQMLEYSSRFDGKNHRSLTWHMVQHVVNHATYHRGQVTMMLRLLGAKPVGTDLIVFHWERDPAPAT